jgi:hypothetical protein
MSHDTVGTSDQLEVQVTRRSGIVEVPKWVKIYTKNLLKMTEVCIRWKNKNY